MCPCVCIKWLTSSDFTSIFSCVWVCSSVFKVEMILLMCSLFVDRGCTGLLTQLSTRHGRSYWTSNAHWLRLVVRLLKNKATSPPLSWRKGPNIDPLIDFSFFFLSVWEIWPCRFWRAGQELGLLCIRRVKELNN